MQRPRSPRRFVVQTILFLIGLTAVCALFAAVHPRVGTAMYRADDKPAANATLPFNAAISSTLVMDIPLQLGFLHPSHFIVFPQGCIDTLEVNGQDIKTSPLCDGDRGYRVSLAPFLHSGTNILHVVMHGNTVGGLQIRTSWTDPLFLLPVILLLLVVSSYGILFLQFISGKREYALLFLIVLVGLSARLAMSWQPGHGSDLSINRGWAHTAAVLGVAESYKKQLDGVMLPNYPPLSMVMFAATGHAYQLLVSPGYDMQLFAYHIFIKLPAIIADLLGCVLLFFAGQMLGGKKWALAFALVWALQPAVIYESAVWGQTDVVFSVCMAAALLAAAKKQWALCGMLAVASFLFKAQAIVLAPVILLLLFHSRKALEEILVGAATMALVVLIPFILSGASHDIWNVYAHSVGYYPNLSLGGYNLWWALYGDASSKDDTGLLFHALTYRTTGSLLFLAATGIILIPSVKRIWRKIWDPDIAFLMLTTALIAYAFFLFNTEMHERYLFPYLILSAPLLFLGSPGIALYALSSFLILWNLLGVLPFSFIDRALYDEFPSLDVLFASLHVCAFVLTFILFWKWERKRYLADLRRRRA